MKPATIKDWIKLPFLVIIHAPFAILGHIFTELGDVLLYINDRLPKIKTVRTKKQEAQIERMREDIRRGSQTRGE